MAKFAGMVGYSTGYTVVNGVATPTIAERKMYGDTIDNIRRLENGESTNDNVRLGNKFSVVADAYAYQNFSNIRYVEWMGTKWKVETVDVARPRLILSCGEKWNGETSGV